MAENDREAFQQYEEENEKEKKMTHIRFFVLNVIVLLAIIFPLSVMPVRCFEKESYQAAATNGIMLFDEKRNIVGHWRAIYYQTPYVDLSGKTNNVISGRVETTAHEYGEFSLENLNFYVFDSVNFNAYANGRDCFYYVRGLDIVNYTYSFKLDHSDYYYFVLEWSFAIASVHLTAVWNYQIIPTSISCSVSSSEVTEGNSITVLGSTSPVSSGLTITLTYRKPDSTTVARTVTTGSDGSYSDTYLPDVAGSWSVKASWTGDSTHAAVSSSSITFTVKSKSFFETPIGMATISSGLIVTVIVIALVTLRRRSV